MMINNRSEVSHMANHPALLNTCPCPVNATIGALLYHNHTVNYRDLMQFLRDMRVDQPMAALRKGRNP
jgi:hypothetical protein